MNHDYDDGDHGNFRFPSHHELPRPNLIWFLKNILTYSSYASYVVTYKHTDITYRLGLIQIEGNVINLNKYCSTN